MFDHVRAFHQPHSVSEALRLLHKKGGQACLVAGGTDLALRAGRSVTDLVDISRLGLSYIKRQGRALHIGATTTMAEMEASELVGKLAGGILARAAAHCGSVQTRNMATVGGNLANASPAADTATPLLALDAAVVLQGERSKRSVALADFFTAPHQTVANGTLLTEIVVPMPQASAAFSLQRMGRTETDIAIVSVAAGLQMDRKGRCLLVRLALGAVSPKPMRAIKTEALLTGQALTAELLQRAADMAADETSPITDLRASAEYRREITRVLVRRAIQDCASQLEVSL